MSNLESQLMAELKLGDQSEWPSVRRVSEIGINALADRHDTFSARKAIDAALDKFDQPLAPHLKIMKRKEALSKRMDKVRAGLAAMDEAEKDIARSLPAIVQPDGAAMAQIDGELRAAFKALPEQRRMNMQAPREMLMAVARAPAILSNIPDGAHERLRDGIRRELHPDVMARIDNERRAVAAARSALQMHAETAKSSLGEAIETHATKLSAA